jgi:hypothetical protein
MKKLLKFALAGLFAGAALVACGGQAHAATPTFNFVNGYQVFALSEIHTVDTSGTFIMAQGASFSDSTIVAKLKASPYIAGFVLFGVTYVNTAGIVGSHCNYSQAQVTWGDGTNVYINDPGCSGYAALKAGSI